jgi:putative addiction module killer protein
MPIIRRTPEYRDWFESLRDRRAMARIDSRLLRAEAGNLGDSRSVGGGVSEFRIDYGPGYRIYFIQRGDIVLLLLCGGDKSSQSKDIAEARRLADKWKELDQWL